jgi:hypothetical protein
VVEQAPQQRGHDLAIDRRLRAERHAQAALVVGSTRHAGRRGEQRRRLEGAVADDVDRSRPAAHELADRALGDDLAHVDDRRDVTRLLDLVEQVRGQQHGAALADQLPDEVAHLQDAGRVEPVHRLVQDQQRRVGQQAARHAEALAHAQRVALDAVIATRGEPDALQRAVDPRRGVIAARGGMDLHVLAAGQVRVKARLLDDRADASERRGTVTRQVAPEQPHATAGRLGQAEQQPDERGLAGAVGAQKAEGAAARHRQVDAVKRHPRAEPLTEADRLNRERIEVNGGSKWHATTVRARRSPRLGRPAARGVSVRMSLLAHLIRSDESRSALRPRERRRRCPRSVPATRARAGHADVVSDHAARPVPPRHPHRAGLRLPPSGRAPAEERPQRHNRSRLDDARRSGSGPTGRELPSSLLSHRRTGAMLDKACIRRHEYAVRRS